MPEAQTIVPWLSLILLVLIWIWYRQNVVVAAPSKRKPNRQARQRLHKQRVEQRKQMSSSKREAMVVSDPEGLSARGPDNEDREVPEALQNLTLSTLSGLDSEVRDRLQDVCANIPEPHPIQKQLAAGFDSPDALVEAVVSDAGLTANILRTVNSASFALVAPITSIRHAITYLGVSVVQGLVAKASVEASGDQGSEEQQMAVAKIWQSASVASAFAQMLGQELGVERPSVLATKALFANLGDVAIVLGFDDGWCGYTNGKGLAERVLVQQQVAGVDAAALGTLLAQHWGLPDEISQALECSYLPLLDVQDEGAASTPEFLDNVLMYLSCRIGERATYQNLRDIGDFDLADGENIDVFFLPQHLDNVGAARLAQLFQNAAFRRKCNRLLGGFS